MSPENAGSTEIGATLRDARRRYGMEVREVEDRTKIRARYIRALENEDWDALPAPAYVRGFLRTYGQLLGLDGEMLADEYRRRHGEGTAPAGPGPSEPLLSESRRPGVPTRAPTRALVVVGALVGIVLVLLVLSLLGGDGDERSGRGERQDAEAREAQREARQKRRQRRQKAERGAAPLQEEDAKLTARSIVQVCLVGAGGNALIDNQVLGTGVEESYSGSKRYRLTIGPGNVRFRVGGSKEALEASEPTSFVGDSNGIREIEYRGPGCP